MADTTAPPNAPAPGARDASRPAGGNASPPKGGGNVFTRKLGPLPAWAWMAIAVGIVLVIVVYEYHKSQSSSSTASDTTPEQITQNYPPESEPASSSSTTSSSSTPPDPAHPAAFKIQPGESPPTTRHGNKVWVHGHVGPKGAYHKGHWSGAGAKGGGVPQPGKKKPAAKASSRTPAAQHRHKAKA
jgi:hypothetical protein